MHAATKANLLAAHRHLTRVDGVNPRDAARAIRRIRACADAQELRISQLRKLEVALILTNYRGLKASGDDLVWTRVSTLRVADLIRGHSLA